jgi:hypothetical protein
VESIRVDKPRPRDIREKGVEADIGFQRGLRVAHHAKDPAPRLGSGGIVEQDKAPGTDVRIRIMTGWGDVRREGDAEWGEIAARRRDFGQHKLWPKGGTTDGIECGAERGRLRLSSGGFGHD